MNKRDFFDRLEKSGNILDEDEIGYLENSLKTDEWLAKKMENHKAWNAPITGEGFVEYYDISEAKAILDTKGHVENWLYDKPTQTLLVNLPTGSHETLMEYLYTYHSRGKVSFCFSSEEGAEKYLTCGYGFFLSGAYQGYGNWTIMKSENYILNAQEKMVFKKWEFRNFNMRGERF